MVERVIATAEALALIEQLKARHGTALMFYLSHGCCDGSSPMCYLAGELVPGRYDLCIGQIGGCPFYVNEAQYVHLQQRQLVIGVTPGNAAGFSLEGPQGLCFVTGSRAYSADEWRQLQAQSSGSAAISGNSTSV
ncbi:MAG: DUF779 domain-containing protein [Burkholderiales bacterium]|uniref:DUF779 domain-containing protein n=1 Tax=Comamonas granuli TaxID=290309 RepID=UPI0005AA6AB5|nr:DUF779 domain-containing protein [Comamonas granuli]MCZ2406805.1 DUF779 domain-containing protein [Burkholderiales bacterium]